MPYSIFFPRDFFYPLNQISPMFVSHSTSTRRSVRYSTVGTVPYGTYLGYLWY